jgi:hypothetical protein
LKIAQSRRGSFSESFRPVSTTQPPLLTTTLVNAVVMPGESCPTVRGSASRTIGVPATHKGVVNSPLESTVDQCFFTCTAVCRVLVVGGGGWLTGYLLPIATRRIHGPVAGRVFQTLATRWLLLLTSS